MNYLIDGHNLIPHVPGLRLDQIDDEDRLVAYLQAFCHKRQADVEVFFDRAQPGTPPTRKTGRVTIRSVREGRTADEAIRLRLQALGKQAAQVTVISADRQVQAEARSARAKVISSVEFARDLLKTGMEGGKADTSERSLSANEVAEWEALFKTGRPPEKKK